MIATSLRDKESHSDRRNMFSICKPGVAGNTAPKKKRLFIRIKHLALRNSHPHFLEFCLFCYLLSENFLLSDPLLMISWIEGVCVFISQLKSNQRLLICCLVGFCLTDKFQSLQNCMWW